MANSTLTNAKAAKMDEFYTQFHDIEIEMEAYLDYNPDVFRGKTILLPCDDPEWSNFTRYFAQNFTALGLKKLISTSYAPESKAYKGAVQLTLFETESPKFDADKTKTHGKIFILTEDKADDRPLDLDDLQWDYLEGDGDFRSMEVRKLRDEADIIVTNPPFSLFREFLMWIMEAGKQFVIIGPVNAITYKEFFPMIKDGRLWTGKGFAGGNAYFQSPDARNYSEGVYDEKTGLIKFRNCCWFTNLDHNRRHDFQIYMTEAENKKHSKHKEVRGVGYKHYDNYDAIEVPYVDAIPGDYDGMMGVPISFLDKYCPEQFEIVGITKTWFRMATKTYPKQIQVSKLGKRTVVSKLNDGAAIELEHPADGEVYYLVDGKYYSQAYARILIRKRKQ